MCIQRGTAVKCGNKTFFGETEKTSKHSSGDGITINEQRKRGRAEVWERAWEGWRGKGEGMGRVEGEGRGHIFEHKDSKRLLPLAFSSRSNRTSIIDMCIANIRRYLIFPLHQFQFSDRWHHPTTAGYFVSSFFSSSSVAQYCS